MTPPLECAERRCQRRRPRRRSHIAPDAITASKLPLGPGAEGETSHVQPPATWLGPPPGGIPLPAPGLPIPPPAPVLPRGAVDAGRSGRAGYADRPRGTSRSRRSRRSRRAAASRHARTRDSRGAGRSPAGLVGRRPGS